MTFCRAAGKRYPPRSLGRGGSVRFRGRVGIEFGSDKCGDDTRENDDGDELERGILFHGFSFDSASVTLPPAGAVSVGPDFFPAKSSPAL